MRRLCWVLLPLAAFGACGGETDGGRPPQPEPVDQRDQSVAPGACGKAGERRPAEGSEAASYCVCRENGRWACYGPDPAAAPMGGAAGAPKASCAAGFVQQAEPSSGSCLMTWTDCTDGHAYMLRCFEGACFCLVDGSAVTELEPSDGCPASVQAVNASCAWALTEATR